QKSITKYQKGVATVIEAEIDEWTKEVIKTTKDPASAFSADDDNESQNPSLIESDLIEFEKITDKSCLKPLEILSTENLKTHAILSLHPRHFGKTLFLSTLSSYYNIKNRDRFEQLFGDLYIGKNPTLLASSFLVFELNFSGLRTNTTYNIFDEDLYQSLNIFILEFMYQYQQELEQHFQIYDENTNALANFSNLLKAVRLNEYKLYVFIDEYDASINETFKNETIFQDLTNHKKEDNSMGKSIFTEAIRQFSLESKNALTYQPNGLCFSFRILNNISKREFIVEALKIHEWKDDDLTPVQQCLQILEGNNDIDLLYRFVEELLLKPLKNNSIVHSNEEVLKQTFLDTLILTLHANIEPEFQFDNIKMECIKLDRIYNSWQGATRISLSLMKKSEDEILNLEISDYYRSNQKTVCEVLDSKIRKKCNDYLEPLKNR
ncbi:18008_t:CDS:2, partial [Funneliformis geosporum]